MNLKTRNKYRDFFGQDVFCTDEVKDYIMDFIERESITKLPKFSDYFSIFSDLVYPVLIKKGSDNYCHFFITDSNNPATIKEVALLPSPNGGSISYFYTDNAGYYIEKNFDISNDNNILHINKRIDNTCISVEYADGCDSSIRTTIKSIDPSNSCVDKYVEISLDDGILLENLEYGFIEETLAAFANDIFAIRSSSLSFYEVISHYADDFSVAINNNGECLKFSYITEKGCRLSAKLLNKDYGISISINPKANLTDVKSLYASFLATNFGIVEKNS